MRDVDRWLREPRRGPVDPEKCIVCASLRGQVIAANRTNDAMLGLVTLSAMRTHRKFGHQDWVKEPARSA
ncbi:hypothetical protein ACFUTR_06715 [Streptomyces sp. NPDC057367]|uniref:hypothetical protein n=1 Tax=Streptomyces sp. NPDC057367 TaxID=3346108 RepID=UPI003625EC11